MSLPLIDQLASAHERLTEAFIRVEGLPAEYRTPSTPDQADLDRGWVALPLTDEHLERLEAIAGFSFSPLLRALFQTAGVMPEHDVNGVLGVMSWVGPSVFEKNEDIARARDEYDWELPNLVAITWDEDFVAVTEDGEVVTVDGTEGNIATRHGSLEGWLARYTEAALRKASDPGAPSHDGDPEAEYV